MDPQASAEFITKYLNQTNGLLARFLENILSSFSDDWWEKNVVENLSYI
jgi:hypothetical protein